MACKQQLLDLNATATKARSKLNDCLAHELAQTKAGDRELQGKRILSGNELQRDLNSSALTQLLSVVSKQDLV